MEAKVSGAFLRAHADHLEIESTGLLTKFIVDEKIEYVDLADIGFKDATIMVKGFIHFAKFRPDGTFFTVKNTLDSLNGEVRNHFIFSTGQSKPVKEIKEFIENWKNENGKATLSKSAGVVDKKTQIEALNKLLETGLISQADYDKQSKSI